MKFDKAYDVIYNTKYYLEVKAMKNIDNIIEQVRQGIKQQEMRIARAREFEQNEEVRRYIESCESRIIELEYRIKELEEKKKTYISILPPKYGDGKYASYYYKEAFDMLRVCYYNYFHLDPSFSPVPKWNMMFYDSTLFLPVDTYLVKGKFPFQIMFSGNYPNYKSNASQSMSIELPFEVLSKKENEEYLRCMLELIKIYSGDSVNLVLGSGRSTRGTLSYIGNKDLPLHNPYEEFFNCLCDNYIRNIIYIGDSMKKGVKSEVIDKVQSEIIDLHRRLVAEAREVTTEEVERSNEEIKKRILSINEHL